MDCGEICLNNDNFIPPEFHINRKLIVEDIVKNCDKHTTVYRKITCQETTGNYTKQNFQVQLQNISYFDNSAHIISNSALQSEFENLQLCSVDNHKTMTEFSEEPMEIDTSSNQHTYESVNNDVTPQLRNLNFRKRHKQNLKPHLYYKTGKTDSSFFLTDEPSSSRFFIVLVVLIALFTLAGIYIVIVGERYIYVNRRLQMENVKNELQQSVLFQERALSIIINAFEQMEFWRDPIRILPFIGTTGVGKTFAANIIKKHFFPNLVHELNGQQLTDTSELQYVIENLNSCCCNLILIDDLTANDMGNFLNFIKKLPRYQNLLIIPIFNIHETTDGIKYKINKDAYKLIRDEIDKSEMYHDLVLFDVFDNYVAEKWLRDELFKRNVDENRHDSIIKFLLDDHHVKYKGLKGLHTKLILAIDG